MTKKIVKGVPDQSKIQSVPRQRDSDTDYIEQLATTEPAPNVMAQKFDVKDFTHKICKFCQVISGVTFHPYEIEYSEGIIETTLLNDGEELTALFSRQSGKTETNACTCAGLMIILPMLAKWFPWYEPIQIYKNGLWVGIFAPSGEQANTTFGRLRTRIKHENATMVMQEEDMDIGINKSSGYISLTNGSIAFPMSANKNANIESKTYHLLLLEECQDIDNRVIKKSIQPMGASTNATVIKVGTANDKRSDFSDAIKRNRRKNSNSKNGRRYHYQYDYKVVQKYNSRYKKYVEKEIERLGGVGADEFRMAYCCEFLFERGMFLTEERYNEILTRTGKFNTVTEKHSGTQCAGIDVAKKGDSTIVTVLDVDFEKPVKIDEDTGDEYYQKRILDWLEITGDDYDSQYYMIINFLNNYNIVRIKIDATGVGEPLKDRLERYYDGIAEVEGMVFSTPSKSTGYLFLMQEFNGDRIDIPNGSQVERTRKGKRFKEQMLDLVKQYKGQYMVCSHPDEKDAHDDYPDSLMLATLAAKSEGMPDVEVEDNDFYQKETRPYYGRVGL